MPPQNESSRKLPWRRLLGATSQVHSTLRRLRCGEWPAPSNTTTSNGHCYYEWLPSEPGRCAESTRSARSDSCFSTMFLIVRPTYNRPAFNQPLPVGVDSDCSQGMTGRCVRSVSLNAND